MWRVAPNSPSGMTTFFRKLEQHGLHRLDVRWGFDDDALMTVTRLAAPKPRKSMFALFDQQPTFEKTSLLPLPEGVESFVELSLNVALFYEIIAKSVPEAVKAQIDEFTGEIQESGKIDLQKDLFAHLGPKMVFYLAPGRSAATTNEESSLESLVSNGLNPMAALTGLPSLFPKLTMVAEVKNPEAFGKALDALIIAINSELKAQAIEKATHEREAEGDQAGAGGAARAGGRNQGTRPGAGGDRTKRRASQGYPGTSFPGHARQSQFVPTHYAVRIHLTPRPARFSPDHPSRGQIPCVFACGRLSSGGDYRCKGPRIGRPSANIKKATEHVPSKLMLLMVSDVAEHCPHCWRTCRGRSRPRSIRRSLSHATRRAPIKRVRTGLEEWPLALGDSGGRDAADFEPPDSGAVAARVPLPPRAVLARRRAIRVHRAWAGTARPGRPMPR